RIRTRDRWIWRPLLYQLSYTPARTLRLAGFAKQETRLCRPPVGGRAPARGAARDPRRARALREVERRPAAVALHPFEHLALGEFSFPARFDDGVLCHGCSPAENYGRGWLEVHR